MKKFISYFLISLLAAGSFLFSPCLNVPLPEKAPPFCIPLNNHMQVSINTDSYSFIGYSIHPVYLFNDKSYRQSRPLYILAGTVAGYAVYYLSYPLHGKIDAYLESNPSFAVYDAGQKAKGSLFVCFYLGFILINLLILSFSMLLFEQIIVALSGRWRNTHLLRCMLLLTLVSSFLVRIHIWSVHLQLFNLLTPLLCVYLALYIKNKKPGHGKLRLVALLSGALLLIYGNFLLLLPVVLAGVFMDSDKKAWAWRCLQLILLFALPTLIWAACLRLAGTSFYSSEVVEYRQFIWIFDELKHSGAAFLSALARNSNYFLQTTGSLFPTLLLLAASFVFTRKEGAAFPEKMIFLFVFLEILLFFWLLGYYTDRLTFSLAPLLLCGVGWLLNRQQLNRRQSAFFVILLAVHHVYNVLYPPFHFSDTLLYR